ncbi:hypothetical protein KP509_02G091900 [Ceratopteris richardii]|uniref:Uncharacterized protein n=1 Tax=Ceratopteris richardii TaxID=49495 RepID=A0A8T2VC68_CERRI|nr:hypothetical protein KP509_02G091900 [Ceratopteris richardii]
MMEIDEDYDKAMREKNPFQVMSEQLSALLIQSQQVVSVKETEIIEVKGQCTTLMEQNQKLEEQLMELQRRYEASEANKERMRTRSNLLETKLKVYMEENDNLRNKNKELMKALLYDQGIEKQETTAIDQKELKDQVAKYENMLKQEKILKEEWEQRCIPDTNELRKQLKAAEEKLLVIYNEDADQIAEIGNELLAAKNALTTAIHEVKEKTECIVQLEAQIEQKGNIGTPVEPQPKNPTDEVQVRPLSPPIYYSPIKEQMAEPCDDHPMPYTAEIGQKERALLVSRLTENFENEVVKVMKEAKIKGKDLDKIVKPFNIPFWLLKEQTRQYIKKITQKDPDEQLHFKENTFNYTREEFEAAQPLWRRKFLEKNPTLRVHWQAAPYLLHINPSFCPTDVTVKHAKFWICKRVVCSINNG